MGIVSRSGGGGSGIGAVLFDSTLGVDTASIDTGAAGIAQTQNVLEVWILARTDDAGSQVNVTVTLNNDATAIYDRQQVAGSNAVASAVASVAQTAWTLSAHGSGGGAAYPAVIRLTIPGYTQTTFNKVAEATIAEPDNTAANDLVLALALGYRSAAAISRLAVAGVAAAKLRAGSRLLILGR